VGASLKRWLHHLFFRLWLLTGDMKRAADIIMGDCEDCGGCGMRDCKPCAGTGWKDRIERL
jgi:hypothetical protein